MRYMVIERFRSGGATAVYERFRERGRMLPEGLSYVDSWVSSRLDVCFQLMECEDEQLFDEWFRSWSDLIDFEVVPVISSAQAGAAASRADDGSGASDAPLASG